MAKKRTRMKKTVSAEDIRRFQILGMHITYAIEDSLGNPDKAVELIGDVLARYKEGQLADMEDEDDD